MVDRAGWSPSTDRTWPPIDAVPLVAEVDAALLGLLRTLTDDEWRRPTIAGTWTVRDVTAHLLDTALRRLSFARDGWMPAATIGSAAEFVALIDHANAQGVQALGRLSPAVLILLMDTATRDLHAYLQSLDPQGTAPFAVSWAGEAQSENWFDIARELTERWHHQAQIRLAVGKPGLLTPRLYRPVLDCFLRALPFTYRTVVAGEGQQVQVVIDGDCGGEWTIERRGTDWRPVRFSHPERLLARTSIPHEIAWRVFTKGIERAEAERRARIDGDVAIGRVALQMTSIVG